jgi:hypothetical protein
MTNTLSRSDWIVLRLICAAVKAAPALRHQPDHYRALADLLQRNGTRAVHGAIDQLKTK